MPPHESRESFRVTNYRLSDDDRIIDRLQLRLAAEFEIRPDGWIFLTPLVTLSSQSRSQSFLLRCRKEERRWIRRAQKVYGRFAVQSPRNWVSYLPDDSSLTKTKRNSFLHWSLHCRGNLFSPHGKMPDQK